MISQELQDELHELENKLEEVKNKLLDEAQYQPDVLRALMGFVAGRIDSVPIYCIFDEMNNSLRPTVKEEKSKDE